MKALKGIYTASAPGTRRLAWMALLAICFCFLLTSKSIEATIHEANANASPVMPPAAPYALFTPQPFASTSGPGGAYTQLLDSQAIQPPAQLDELISSLNQFLPEGSLSTLTDLSNSLAPLSDFQFITSPMESAVAAGRQASQSSSHYSCRGLPDSRRVQCQALVALYISTQGDDWLANDGWLMTADYCNWTRIICDGDKNVVELLLGSNRLFGHIPDEIGFLNVQVLDLSNNYLSGVIPRMLAESDTLRTVNISNNRLTGSYPLEFWRLDNSPSQSPSYLRRNLEGNRFTHVDIGSFDCSSVDGTYLQELIECEALLAFFRSTNGEDPDSYYYRSAVGTYGKTPWLVDPNPCKWVYITCSNRRVVQLEFKRQSGPELTGRIPLEIGMLSQMTLFVVEDGDLSGPIPAEIAALQKLQILRLPYNRLWGAIPITLGDLPVLHSVDLSGNPNLCIPTILVSAFNKNPNYRSPSPGPCNPADR